MVEEMAGKGRGSEMFFSGYIDAVTGYLVCPNLLKTAARYCRMEVKEVVFKELVGLWGWVLNNRRSLLTNDAARDPRPRTCLPAIRKSDVFW